MWGFERTIKAFKNIIRLKDPDGSGEDSKGATPVTISNTEVKSFSAYGTGSESSRESRSSPGPLFINKMKFESFVKLNYEDYL